MKKQNGSVRRSLIVSATALMISVAMLLGTTFAWFTDSVSSGKNKIVAGNLDIEVTYKQGDKYTELTDETTDLFFAPDNKNGLWEPGHTEIAYLKVTNVGTLAVTYQAIVDFDNATTFTNKNGEQTTLDKYLKYGVQYSDKEFATLDRAAAEGYATTLLADYSGEKQRLKAGETQYIALVVTMPIETGNEANAKVTENNEASIDLTVHIKGTQDTVENDSFGSDYDAAAADALSDTEPDDPPQEDEETSIIVDGTNGNTLSEAVKKISSKGTITLAADANISESGLTIPEGKTITLNLAGYTVTATNDPEKNIKVQGNLTIKDSKGNGKISSATPCSNTDPDDGVLAVLGSGVFTLESGTIEANSQEKKQVGISLADTATVNIRGGEVETSGHAIESDDYKTTDDTINISGGEVHSTKDDAIYYSQNGTVNISGDAVEGATNGIQMTSGTLNVTGGKIACSFIPDMSGVGSGNSGPGHAAIYLNAQHGNVNAEVAANVRLGASQSRCIVIQNTGRQYKVTLTGENQYAKKPIEE